MLGGYVSELEPGDVLEPITYVLTPFLVREYCRGVEEWNEAFQSTAAYGVQYAPPTLAHIDKIRLLRKNCPKTKNALSLIRPGVNVARVHYEYFATHRAAIEAGEELRAEASVTETYVKRARRYLEMELRVIRTRDEKTVTTYLDTSVLSYEETEKK